MADYTWAQMGISLPTMYLPKQRKSLEKWCVIACDQYTSDPAYWQQVEQTIGAAPSTRHMVLPEVYLEADDVTERIAKTADAMREYLHDVLEPIGPGMILIQRTFANNNLTRTGLLMALDLERYDYAPDAKTLIRASEGTIPSRIPPRLRIRRNALLELPHIMVLLDDPNHTVIEPLTAKKEQFTKLYDSALGFGMGAIEGYFVAPEQAECVRHALSALWQGPLDGGQGDHMLFAMGDGNHSLATAKAYWEELKPTLSQAEQQEHPGRFALCEVVNLHDQGIVFEPIHRVVFGCTVQDVQDAIEALGMMGENGPLHKMQIVCGEQTFDCAVPACSSVESGTADVVIAEMLRQHPQASVDYIHGEAETRSLAQNGHNVGFLLPVLQKSDLFPVVAQTGPLPRKAFSMGEADEKRCYLEARAIRRD